MKRIVSTVSKVCEKTAMHLEAVGITFIAIVIGVKAGHKCVWVHGVVRCNKDPSRNLNVEVRAYDRDGISIAKLIDPDDLMGYTKIFSIILVVINYSNIYCNILQNETTMSRVSEICIDREF